MHTKEKTILHFWKFVLWTGSVALLAWLFFQNLVPTGVLVLQHQKGSALSPITDLHPDKRLIDLPNDGNNQRIYVDPVYFDAKVPREFDTVTVDIAWENQSQPIIELGARKVRGAWGFVMRPLQNILLDDIRETWECDQYSGVLFCQKEKQYSNLSAYFNNPPATGTVVYNYALPEGIQADVMNVNTQLAEYQYVIATYTSPEELGNDWYRTQVVFNWQDFALHINEISFLLSAPELHKGNGQVVVGDVVIALKRDPLDWGGLWEYMESQFGRLTN